jgi:hypothetical protein
LDLYRERSRILKECLYISLKIKEESEKNTSNQSNQLTQVNQLNQLETVDIISELTDKRALCLQEIKNTETAIHHYGLSLTDSEKQSLKAIKEAVKNGEELSNFLKYSNSLEILEDTRSPDYIWVGELYNILENDKNMISRIKKADEVNFKTIKLLLGELKTKIKSVKGNRILMDKFVGDASLVSLGTLMNEKK